MLTLADKVWIKLKSAFLHITLTRHTTAHFLFAFIHCFVQGIIQSFLFSVDSDATTLVSTILREANNTQSEFAWLIRDNGNFELKLCDHVPSVLNPDACDTIYRTGRISSNLTPSPVGFRREVDLDYLLNVLGPRDDGDIDVQGTNSSGVVMSIDSGANQVILNQQCTQILIYPNQVLQNSQREDLALIGSQFWLFSVSFFGILYDSIPHILAVLCTRVLATGWSAYSIWRTGDIQVRFQNLIVDPQSPCNVDLFPSYFKTRTAFEIPDLVLNCTALVLSAYLSWHLVKAYAAHSFKRACPPKGIIRIYRFFLAVFVCLQLSVYFLVTAIGLWVDQLFNSPLGAISSHTPIYIALFISTMLLLLPWITMGWNAVRHEKKKLMMFFLSTVFVLVACWAIMFYSLVYRWTFVQWPFFACMTVSSFIVMIASGVLGGICWLNFNKGLRHYLHVEEVLSKVDFEPEVFSHDLSKVSFDADEKPPDYSMLKGIPAPVGSRPASSIIDIKRPVDVFTMVGRHELSFEMV